MQCIDKAAVVAEIEKRLHANGAFDEVGDEAWAEDVGMCNAYKSILSFLDTLEVKEINIASMADEYYDALMEEASDWMDEGTMGHCRLAYYTGCKDVLNKIRKGE